ncbi:MAG: ABC transporter permease, partial [Spirochaetaceae bacterium]|nr:ABC transporter permease [Spirochaetaceae bacterium]
MRTAAGCFVALRYLLGRAHEGGRYLRGAAAGIALSLVPIILTLIVADGMIWGITDRYLELGTGHLQVYNSRNAAPLDTALPLIQSLESVRGAWAEQQGLGVLVGKHGKTGGTIRAIDPSFWEDPGSQAYLVTVAGEAAIRADQDVLLGEALAASLQVGIGDTIRIMTIRLGTEGRAIPRLTPFTVRGIISSGYRELDALWCIISSEAGKKILPTDLSASYLMVKLQDPYREADRMAPFLRDVLGTGYRVYTWKELQQSQYRSYESTRQLLLFIMALIVLVAAVNVSSATSMLVIERQRDIAVLKAAGVSPKDASGIFLWGSFLTGLTGAFMGIGAGLFLGIHINEIIHGLEGLLGLF